MASFLQEFKERLPSSSVVKAAVLNIKALSGLGLAFFLIFVVGSDYVLGPGLESVQKEEKKIEENKKSLKDKRDVLKRYDAIKESLETLPSKLKILKAGESPKVLAVSLQQALIREVKELDSKPLDQSISKVVEQSSKQKNADSDEKFKAANILSNDPTASASPSKELDLPSPSKKQSTRPVELDEPIRIVRFTPRSQERINLLDPKATPLSPQLDGKLTDLSVWRFDYELVTTGSYIALSRLINHFSIHDPLIVIQGFRFEMAEKAPDSLRYIPLQKGMDLDALIKGLTPPQPARVELTLTFSMFAEAV